MDEYEHLMKSKLGLSCRNVIAFNFADDKLL